MQDIGKHIRQQRLRQHLWPGYLLWGIAVFTLGVALCFTEKS